MSFRQEFDFTISDGLSKISVWILVSSLSLAVLCELFLGAKNIVSEIQRFLKRKRALKRSKDRKLSSMKKITAKRLKINPKIESIRAFHLNKSIF